MGEERGTFELLDPSKSPEGTRQHGGRRGNREGDPAHPATAQERFSPAEVNDLPIPEVAEHLGISVAAAKSRLLRARQELRSRVVRHCGRSGLASLTA